MDDKGNAPLLETIDLKKYFKPANKKSIVN